MNVLSLFDGMSCTQIALNRMGIRPSTYFASEIDPYGIKVTQANFPDTIQVGDVTKLKTLHGCLLVEHETDEKSKFTQEIDLLVGGSPCQGFSFAGRQLNFDDPRSKLFFEYVRLLKELKPKYFLLENVNMKQEYQDIISDALGCKPIDLNSNRVSAQNRRRLYWTNIPVRDLPENKHIYLKDILEDGFTDRDKSHCIDANYFKGGNLKSYFEKHRRQLVFDFDDPTDDGLRLIGEADLKGHDYNRRVYHPDGKAPSLCANSGGNLEPKIFAGSWRGRYRENGVRQDHKMPVAGLAEQELELREDGKTNSLTTVQKDNVAVNVEELKWRKLTPIECERLQTVPDNYTNHVSNTQRYRMLGNGFTVDVICHLLKGITNASDKQV